MNKVIWKDNSEPARKIGVWPFCTTFPAEPANRWEGYDSETGEALHSIRKTGIGYDICARNGNPNTRSFLTLEHAKDYCENPAWPHKIPHKRKVG